MNRGPLVREIRQIGSFRLDPERRRLQRADGEAISLGARAFDALVLLVEHAGEPVSRKTLIDALWPHTVVEENNVTQAISSLRRVLGKGYIATLPGRGYQFVAEVRVCERDVPTIGSASRRAAARSVLERTVRKCGNRLRISAELVDVDNGYARWSATYERELEDVFAIRKEIASAVVDALSRLLGVVPPQPAAEARKASRLTAISCAVSARKQNS